MSRIPSLSFAFSWILTLFVAGMSLADVVYLANGRSMEGIVLEESAAGIRLQLAFGEIGLPRSSVLRVERADSALAEYLARRRALARRTETAKDWLTLAHWADENGLGHSAREAVVVAARLAPDLAGLAPLMQRFGYEYDAKTGVWLKRDELMRQRGFVESEGRWLSPAEVAAGRRAREESNRRRQEELRQERITRAMEMMALTRIAEAEAARQRLDETPTYPIGLPLWGGYPVVMRPPQWPRSHGWSGERHKPDGARVHHRHERVGRSAEEQILSRPPGSWIPITPPRVNHGGLQRVQHSADP